jgi:hypothetical protein
LAETIKIKNPEPNRALKAVAKTAVSNQEMIPPAANAGIEIKD